MLNDAKIMCFAATTNADAARAFYQDVLGLVLIEDSPFAIAFDANGTMLRIQKVAEHTPAKHTSLGWVVNDIRATIESLAALGVHFDRFDGLNQDELGVWTSPSGARIAWFRDPEGNVLSITEHAG